MAAQGRRHSPPPLPGVPHGERLLPSHPLCGVSNHCASTPRVGYDLQFSGPGRDLGLGLYFLWKFRFLPGASFTYVVASLLTSLYFPVNLLPVGHTWLLICGSRLICQKPVCQMSNSPNYWRSSDILALPSRAPSPSPTPEAVRKQLPFGCETVCRDTVKGRSNSRSQALRC